MPYFALLVLHKLPVYPAVHPSEQTPSIWEHWFFIRHQPHVFWQLTPYFPISHTTHNKSNCEGFLNQQKLTINPERPGSFCHLMPKAKGNIKSQGFSVLEGQILRCSCPSMKIYGICFLVI